jgi:hypothetical protein
VLEISLTNDHANIILLLSFFFDNADMLV